MLTPQQIDQISFGRATFGGYDMQDVDDFLTPLTEDYVTLYKENSMLKSKMRMLVGKLEEYRKNEAAMKEAVLNAKRNCEKMVREAEAKAAQVLADAQANANAKAAEAKAAEAKAKEADSDALVSAEDARVEEARKAAAAKIDELQEQLRTCIQALERIKTANAPAEAESPPHLPLPLSPNSPRKPRMWWTKSPPMWKPWSAPPTSPLPSPSPSIPPGIPPPAVLQT